MTTLPGQTNLLHVNSSKVSKFAKDLNTWTFHNSQNISTAVIFKIVSNYELLRYKLIKGKCKYKSFYKFCNIYLIPFTCHYQKFRIRFWHHWKNNFKTKSLQCFWNILQWFRWYFPNYLNSAERKILSWKCKMEDIVLHNIDPTY